MGIMRPVALVAQLDRVLPSEGRGRGFESRRVRHEFRHFRGFAPTTGHGRDSSVTAKSPELRGFFVPAICELLRSAALGQHPDKIAIALDAAPSTT